MNHKTIYEPFREGYCPSIFKCILDHDGSCVKEYFIFYGMSEEEEGEVAATYCPQCGTCGYIGCCGVANWLKSHVEGKTNCPSEDSMIEEIKSYVDVKE